MINRQSYTDKLKECYHLVALGHFIFFFSHVHSLSIFSSSSSSSFFSSFSDVIFFFFILVKNYLPWSDGESHFVLCILNKWPSMSRTSSLMSDDAQTRQHRSSVSRWAEKIKKQKKTKFFFFVKKINKQKWKVIICLNTCAYDWHVCVNNFFLVIVIGIKTINNTKCT